MDPLVILGVIGVLGVLVLAAVLFVRDVGRILDKEHPQLMLRAQWIKAQEVSCKNCGWRGPQGEFDVHGYCPVCGSSKRPNGYTELLRGSGTMAEAVYCRGPARRDDE
jgi:hypothetical protein